MPEHLHSGPAHAIGSRPPECRAAGFAGPVVACDRAGWFDPARPLVCRHAEPPPGGFGWTPYVPSASGAGAPPTGTPPTHGWGSDVYIYGGAGGGGGGGGGHVHVGAPPVLVPPQHPWTDPERVPGDPAATVRFRRRAGYAYDRNDPLQVVEIPCNPDAIAEQRVRLKVTRPATSTGAVGAPLAGVMDARIHVAFPKDHEIEVDHVFKGEHCRSVRYEIFVQYVVFDVELNVPGQVPETFSVSEPVGWFPVKRHIDPTCCTATTERIQKSVEKSAATSEPPVRHALVRAADHLLAARGFLPHPGRISDATDAYARAARLLADAERGGADVSGPLSGIARIARGLAGPVVSDALASRLGASDALLGALIVRGGSEAAADLATGDAARAESPADAVVWYVAALHHASAALDVANAARFDAPVAAKRKPRRA
ncbi:MAG: hypothetical protein HMLKMBBP_01170 [Planctomycetes bacterium]|nr:hypothetical protein [Planctomycetota bacterium]